MKERDYLLAKRIYTEEGVFSSLWYSQEGKYDWS